MIGRRTSILKECKITGQYPREYRGWEDAYRRLKFCWKSKFCEKCPKGSCGEFSQRDRGVYNGLKLLIKAPNVFHIVIFGTLIVIALLSLLAVGRELLQYQLGSKTGILIGSVWTTISLILFFGFIYFLWHIHCGKYSFALHKRLWADLLEKCPYQI